MNDYELYIRMMLALEYLNLLDRERDLLENILDETVEITQVLVVDEYGVVVSTEYEYINGS